MDIWAFLIHVGSYQFRELLRELLRELWFSYCSNPGMPFREWDFVFGESLREYPGTLPELREWPFHSKSVFPEIGVVFRLLNDRVKPSCPCALGAPLRSSQKRLPLHTKYQLKMITEPNFITLRGGKSTRINPPKIKKFI